MENVRIIELAIALTSEDKLHLIYDLHQLSLCVRNHIVNAVREINKQVRSGQQNSVNRCSNSVDAHVHDA